MSEAERVEALVGVNGPDDPGTSSILRRRRVFYGIVTAALSLLLLAAVIGSVTGVDTYGVSSARTSAEGGGFQLEVEYPTVSRGGLASPLSIEVTDPDGFTGPITIAVDHSYMQMWDENGFYPTPSSETTMGDWLVWEFDPPIGTTLSFTYDGRIEPSVQSGRAGRVAVLEEDVPVAVVELETRIMP